MLLHLFGMSAYLFAARVGYVLQKVKTRPGIAVWADLLSGDKDPTDECRAGCVADGEQFFGGGLETASAGQGLEEVRERGGDASGRGMADEGC